MQVVTAELMRELDRRAMAEAGLPGVVLMENAGRAVFSVLAHRFGPLRDRQFLVACGTGNNGGDGFVVARYLRLAGAEVSVSVAGDPARIRGDALAHFNILRGLGVELAPLTGRCDTVKVDALLGTGITGAPRADAAAAINALNGRPGITVAVDIPSGVNADTGDAPGAAVRADITVTFAYPKIGLLVGPGADLAGEIVVDPIGFDWDVLRLETPYEWLRAPAMRRLLPPRPREGHKGTFGHVLVVGGSVGMSGAPIMSSLAAARTGSGLVTAAVAGPIQPIVAQGMDELMTIPLPDDDGALTEESADAILQFASKCDVACLGPGLRVTDGTVRLVARLLRDIQKPIVLDADGLNALASHPEVLKVRAAPMILTPHPGECARLVASTVPEVERDRVAAVRELARQYRAVAVLKGARTLICDGRSNDAAPIGINTTGNAGMATGGAGDTLTGIIGSLVGQGAEAWDAARLGVFIHAAAGDLAAAERHTRGLTAGDISDKIPAALRELEECS